jgi:hypothetical protein
MCSPAIEKAAERRMADFAQGLNWFADNEVGRFRSRYLTLHAALSRFIAADGAGEGSALGRYRTRRGRPWPAPFPYRFALETIDFDEERNEADLHFSVRLDRGDGGQLFRDEDGDTKTAADPGCDGFSVIQREDEPDA